MKQKISISIIILMLAGCCLVEACKKKDVAKATTPVRFTTPAGWPSTKYDFTANPLTQEAFDLGRKLFYDGRLSKDGNFPCASCHQQFAAFATFDHNLSHGFNNQFTTRNAPSLFNIAWQSTFHLDGGINHLDVQPLAPITAPNEMAETIDNVLNKLRADAKYKAMFTAAFGDTTINTQRMTKALSQFMLMMVSNNSKYDKVKRGEATFSVPEAAGYEIFKAKCAACHVEPLFTDFSFRNIGMPISNDLRDFGRMRITGNRADSLKFRVPSLRNVQFTFPYGHDGRFYTLNSVMEHYRSGVVNGPTTDPLVRSRIPLSNYEIGQLTAFMNALTDTSFVEDKRFGPPQ